MYREKDEVTELRVELDRVRAELAVVSVEKPTRQASIEVRDVNGDLHYWVLSLLLALPPTSMMFFLPCWSCWAFGETAWAVGFFALASLLLVAAAFLGFRALPRREEKAA